MASVARCERLGIAAYLLKPAKQSELFDAMMLALRPSVTDVRRAGYLPSLRPPQASSHCGFCWPKTVW